MLHTVLDRQLKVISFGLNLSYYRPKSNKFKVVQAVQLAGMENGLEKTQLQGFFKNLKSSKVQHLGFFYFLAKFYFIF